MNSLRYLVLVSLLALCPWLSAHEVRPAFLQITEIVSTDSDAAEARSYEILWKQPVVQNGRLAIDPVFPSGCILSDQTQPELTPAALIHRWTTDCDLRQASIHIRGLSVTLTDVMVRYDRADGTNTNYILRPENPTLDLAQNGTSTLNYLVIGVEHLVFGIDHVLFVIGLALFVRGPWTLVKTITAFTVAHSITLALSVLGWVRLEQGPVEVVIALSIVFLARELLQEEQQRSYITQGRPWIMAFLFGLLHGLGFAGALSDIGLPEDTLWLSLLLFNVGLELGQLVIIAILLASTWLLGKLINLTTVTRLGAYGMGCVAMFWTIDRTWLLL